MGRRSSTCVVDKGERSSKNNPPPSIFTYQDFDPVPKVPEPEPEHPAVSVLKVLIWRDDAVKETWGQSER